MLPIRTPFHGTLSRWCVGAFALLALGASDARAEGDAKLLSYGRHVAQECSGCHRVDGIDNGIPSITGWPIEQFLATLAFYRSGTRTNPVMVSVATSLDDEQMRALATYYGSLPKRVTGPAAATQPAKKK